MWVCLTAGIANRAIWLGVEVQFGWGVDLFASNASTVRSVHAVAFEVEIRIPAAQSLKDRRQVVRSLLDGARHRFGVSAAEVGGQDTWQRATLGFAAVASEARIAEETIGAIDRFLWSRPDIEVLDGVTHWLA